MNAEEELDIISTSSVVWLVQGFGLEGSMDPMWLQSPYKTRIMSIPA